MTPDPATLTGLLEVCHANGIDLSDLASDPSNWMEDESVQLAKTMRFCTVPLITDAVCFRVARWLRDEHGLCLKREYGLWYLFNLDDRPVTFREVEYPDSEPAALLAVCKEFVK